MHIFPESCYTYTIPNVSARSNSKQRKRGNLLFPFIKQESQTDANYQNLLDNLTQTMNSLHLAYENFENATDPELIDSYIYEVNAIQMRYKFLLCRLKSYEIAEP